MRSCNKLGKSNLVATISVVILALAPSYDSTELPWLLLWMNSSNMHCKDILFPGNCTVAQSTSTWTLCSLLNVNTICWLVSIAYLCMMCCFCYCKSKGKMYLCSWLNAIAVSMLCKIYIHKKMPKKCTWSDLDESHQYKVASLNLLPQTCCHGEVKVQIIGKPNRIFYLYCTSREYNARFSLDPTRARNTTDRLNWVSESIFSGSVHFSGSGINS